MKEVDETSPESMKAWQFLRRHLVRIVIGAVLAAMVYGMLIVWMPYQREQRIAKEIRALGGSAVFRYAGPNWIPQSVQTRMPFLDRIQIVRGVSDAGLEHLKGLTRLKLLDLNNNFNKTKVTDAGLEHLKGVTSFKFLNLAKTQITDTGLEHLKKLTSLKDLFLQNTKVTAEGKAMLRNALPACKIYP